MSPTSKGFSNRHNAEAPPAAREYLGQADNHTVLVRYFLRPPRKPYTRPLILCYGDGEENVKHSPSGFAWGYGGSGPAQLAFAILACELGPTSARKYYQDFKWAVVAELPEGEWKLTSIQIRDEISKIIDEPPQNHQWSSNINA